MNANAMNLPRLFHWLIIVAFALALLTGLENRRLGRPFEGSQIEVAREMVSSGDWLVPHLNGAVYLDRPPLMNWITALSLKIFGDESAWAARLPSILAAAGALWLTAWIGRMLGDARTGLAAAGVLLSCLNFFGYVGASRPEMMSTFWVVAAMACFVRHASGGGRWFEAGFFSAMGLGLLTDGWMAAAIPMLGALGWNVGRYRTGKPITPLRWIRGLSISLAIPVAWLVAVRLREGSMPVAWGTDGTLALFGNSDPERDWTWSTSLFVFAVGTFPWLPVAFGSGLNWLALRKANWRVSPTGWMLAGWAVAALIVMLLVGPQSFGNSLPIFPAFALWIAGRGRWRDSDQKIPQGGLAGFWSMWWERVSLLCALAFIVSPALAIAAASLTLPSFRQKFSLWFGLLLGLLAVGCCLSTYLWTRRSKLNVTERWGAFEEAAGVALTVLGIGLWLLLGSQLDRLGSD
jgi:4-amino-4-deoxy-L-arabinose transferase-like glycosyltransferase